MCYYGTIGPRTQRGATEEHTLTMTRVWTINGRFLTQPLSGVQRYAQEIVEAMDTLIAEGYPSARGLKVELVVPPGAVRGIELKAIRQRIAGSRGGHVWEQFILPREVRGGLLSLGNTGPVATRRQVLCIHDLNTRAFPGSYSLPFRLLYRTLIPALGRTAARIATVSEYSADELTRYGVARRDKIDIMYNGHEHALRWRPEHSEATRAVAGPRTVLVIGSPAPHKNVGLLLGLADRLAAAGLSVAVAGAKDSRVFGNGGTGDAAARAANIHWLGRISDNELAALYSDCLCLAFPSFVEGFGIPAMEAMVWGCPVVASDRTSLPEVCGDAALYASPDAADAWLAQLTHLASNETLRQMLAGRGKARITRFSWRQSAHDYLRLLARIDGMDTVEAA